ncbi:MAG: D-2-hydroxyacid dehydrogenase [Gammaproteobacteria bacterium]|jgi:glycerate dehydrogenase
MRTRPVASFLDFATLGPGVSTTTLDDVVEARYFDYSDPGEVRERLERSEVVLLNKVKLDRSLIEAARDLQLIVVTATGCDNVDTAAAEEAGVAVANVRDYCSGAVAQHVFALVLSLTQQIGRYDSLVRSGVWSAGRSFSLFDYPIRELQGRNLGIVGFGSLGRSVARIGEAFGMNVLVAGRIGSADPLPEGRIPFDEVLVEADVLSLHCPLTDATRHVIDAGALARMKRDSLLINTARGALVDYEALASALQSGEIAGAGIDVFAAEPPPATDPLLGSDLPNLIVTPHIAWAALESRQRALDQAADNIAAFYAGNSLRRLV